MKRLPFLLILLIAAVSACARASDAPASDDVNITLQLLPEPAVVGEATVIVTLADAVGNPIEDATVHVKGDMNHAGMVPVLAEADQGLGGMYEMPFEWTMGGSWIVTVEATLADGTTATRRFDVSVGMPASQ
ncbi:MAG: FixH family protein [Anaerolineae bacterium]|nr:FixH family protein [Anaerolineae bacterium]